jgi:hypothetical protein
MFEDPSFCSYVLKIQVFVHMFWGSIWVFFFFVDTHGNVMFWLKGQSLYISGQCNAQI